eukprot:scaffold11185_cov176-Isochrysis_galbana.AAC.1
MIFFPPTGHHYPHQPFPTEQGPRQTQQQTQNTHHKPMTTKGGDPHHFKQCYTSTHYNSPSPNLKGDRLPTNFPPPPPPH